MQADALLPFLLEMDRLKSISRQTLVYQGRRAENAAEHSWHLAIAVLIFRHLAPPNLDIEKSLRMALLHDIVEIDAGDTFIYDESGDKNPKEIAALHRLASLLPAELGSDFQQIWLEFEKRESIEARYVNALDRFLPLYSNALNQGYSWKKHGISATNVIAKNQSPIESGLPSLWETAKRLIDEAVASGHLDGT
jgi:putative hydrolase of HD superfamily